MILKTFLQTLRAVLPDTTQRADRSTAMEVAALPISDFYLMEGKSLSSTFQVQAEGLLGRDDDGVFYEHRLIMGEYANISFPVVFKQKYGTKLRDMLDTGWPGLHLISDNMLSVMKEAQQSGFKTFPVTVLDRKGNVISGYSGLSVTGRCGRIDYDKSSVVLEKSLIEGGPTGKYLKGLYVGLDQWDGSDIFLPNANFSIIVTRKTMEALQLAKISNIVFHNLGEIETPSFGVPQS